MHPAHIQILSLGALWILFHCAPMCGPILSGLQLTGQGVSSTVTNLLAYQLGRAAILGSLGALAAWSGESITSFTPHFGWLVTLVLIFMALSKWFRVLSFRASIFDQLHKKLTNILATLMKRSLNIGGHSASPTTRTLRAFLLGLILAFLPCMLVGWAITLAAGTSDPLDGAITLWLLVLLTTLPLGLVVLGSHALRRWQRPWTEALLLTISALWTLLMTLGANELIPHFHFNFSLGSEHYHMMFW